jgi:hypothetical protein
MLTELSTNSKSTKSLIINVLTKEFPLSAKQIHNKIKKAGISISYHGVYDSLKEMVTHKILKKVEMNYSIEPKWIDSIGNVYTNLKISYARKSKLLAYNTLPTRTFACNSMIEVKEILKRVRNDFIDATDPKKGSTTCWITTTMYAGILNITERVWVAERFKEKNIKYYALLSKDTEMNRFVEKFYNSIGLNTKVIGNLNAKFSIGIYGDVLVYVVFSPKADEIVEDFHKISDNLDDKGIKKFLKMSSVNTGYHVIVVKDKNMSKKYIDYIVSKFKQK